MVESLVENRSSAGLEIKDKFEAGLVLTGAEVKSLRQGQATLNHAYVRVVGGEALLFDLRIGHYSKSGRNFPKEDRVRKILLNRGEIDRLSGLLSQKGLVCVPLKLYLKNGLIKAEIGVGRLLRKWQKKEKLIEKDILRETAGYLKTEE